MKKTIWVVNVLIILVVAVMAAALESALLLLLLVPLAFGISPLTRFLDKWEKKAARERQPTITYPDPNYNPTLSRYQFSRRELRKEKAAAASRRAPGKKRRKKLRAQKRARQRQRG